MRPPILISAIAAVSCIACSAKDVESPGPPSDGTDAGSHGDVEDSGATEATEDGGGSEDAADSGDAADFQGTDGDAADTGDSDDWDDTGATDDTSDSSDAGDSEDTGDGDDTGDDTATDTDTDTDDKVRLGAEYLGPSIGTRFNFYAPSASAVSVTGTFNRWGSTPMTETTNAGYTYWTVTVSNAMPEDLYRYRSADFYFDEDVSDPYGMAFSVDDEATIIVDASDRPDAFPWSDSNWVRPAKGELVIYEMQVEDFTDGDSRIGASLQGTIAGVEEKIPYLVELGVNAVELMPMQEWGGEGYSWGYNTRYHFGVENGYARNAEDGSVLHDFASLVNALHNAGIAVILDVVYNHGDEESPLYVIDAERYFDLGNDTDWGPRFDFTSADTRGYFRDNLLYWMDEFHIDGFRFDGTQHIDGPGFREIVVALYNDDYDDRYFIVEDFDADRSAQIQVINASAGRSIFSSWGVIYKDDEWAAMFWNDYVGLGTITYYSNARGWNFPASAINYFTSHDEGTLIGRFGATAASPAFPAANALDSRLAFTHVMTSLGVPMLWMGDEINRIHYGNYVPPDAGFNNVSEEANHVEWDALLSHADNQLQLNYFSRVVALRGAHANLRLSTPEPDNDTGVDRFDWNMGPGLFAAWNSGGLAYVYKASRDHAFAIFINFTHNAIVERTAILPMDGTWTMVVDSKAAQVDENGLGPTLAVSGGYATVSVQARQAVLYMSPSPMP